MANMNDVKSASVSSNISQMMAVAAIEIAKGEILSGRASLSDIPSVMRKSFDAMAETIAGLGLVVSIGQTSEVVAPAAEASPVAVAPALPVQAPKAASKAGKPTVRKNGYNAPVMTMSDEEFLNRYPPVCTEAESLSDPLHLKCLIDGQNTKFLRRWLARYGISHEDYIRIYGLSENYPYTPQVYKTVKHGQAKQIGLGTTLSKKPKSEREAEEALLQAASVEVPVEAMATPKARSRRTKRIEARAA